MNVRRYKPGEENELWELYHNTTHKIVSQDYTTEQVERWAPRQIDMDEWKERIRGKNPFVVEQNGAVLGFAELESDGHIDRFYTHHAWQRKGVGSLLYKKIEEEARRRGLSFLYAEVSTTAKPFFLKMGFYITEEQENVICGNPAQRYLMRKNLAGY